jgi:hypothetical protein
VFRFARGELPTSWDDLSAPFSQFGSALDQRGHPEYDSGAADPGRPRIAFSAVTYVVNHAESLWRVKARGQRPVGAVQDLGPPSRARRVLSDDSAALAKASSGYRALGRAAVRAANAQAQLLGRLKAVRS